MGGQLQIPGDQRAADRLEQPSGGRGAARQAELGAEMAVEGNAKHA